MNVPLIVNHKTDPDKVNGLVTSTYSYLAQNAEGDLLVINVNMVVWPGIPSPLHHQETDDDLEFVSVYDINGDNEADEDEDDEGAEFTDDEDGEGVEFADDEAGVDLATTTTTTDVVVDAEQASN